MSMRDARHIFIQIVQVKGLCRAILVLTVWWLLGPNVAITRGQTYLQDAGIPTFTTQIPVENGFIDTSSGRLHLEIPVGTFPQRGGRTAKVSYVYDSNIWQPDGGLYFYPDNTALDYADTWRLITSVDGGYILTFTGPPTLCAAGGTTWEFGYQDPYGSTHSFAFRTCSAGYGKTSGSGYATDGSGYFLTVTNSTIGTVYAPDGTLVQTDNSFGGITTLMKDTNGNYIGPNSGSGYVDTIGRTLPIDCWSDQCEYSQSTSLNATAPNSQGTSNESNYTVTTGSINVSTNWGSGYTNYSGSITVITKIQLPDGTTYAFTYDSGTTPGHYGLLTSMKTSTMASTTTINYTWNIWTDAQGNVYPRIATRTTPDGEWKYTQSTVGTTCTASQVDCQQTFTIQKPTGEYTVYTFALNGGAWPILAQYYNGSISSANLLTSTSLCWNFVTVTSGQCTYSVTTAIPAANVFLSAQTTTVPIPGGTNLNATKEFTWDTYGNMSQLSEWNYYSGTLPSTADRTTTIAHLNTSSYISANILNRPSSVIITNSSGSTVSKTLYSYDGSSLTSITNVQNHDDTNYGTGNTVRGNLTEIQRLVSGTSTYLTKSMTYDMTGQMLTSSDWSNSNSTSYSYTDAYVDDNTTNSTPTAHSTSTPTNAFATTVTGPLSAAGTTAYKYYWGSGQVAEITDGNSNTTVDHYGDYFDRPTSEILSNLGWTLTQYDVSGVAQVGFDHYTAISGSTTPSSGCSTCRHDQVATDSLGRAVDGYLVNDPDGEDTVATAYDTDGRVGSRSAPYRASSDSQYPCSSSSTCPDSFTYDGIDRMIQVTHVDGEKFYSYYGVAVGTAGGQSTQLCTSSTYGKGYPILLVDETARKRQTWADAFGRIIEIDEPDSSGGMTANTCYSFDMNNDLTGVKAVGGSQTRSYTYDLLSRVTSKTEPESSTTNFYYTTSGGSLCSGALSAICRRTDARSITATYVYDALNRLTSISYSDSTPQALYGYDAVAPSGCTPPTLTITNGKGRRTSMCDGSGKTSWSFDSVGNALTEKRVLNGQTNTISYAYNLDSSVQSVTYPSNRTVAYSYNNAQRAASAIDSTDGINYAKGPASGAMYAPIAVPEQVLFGYASGGYAGTLQTDGYDTRLQLSHIKDVTQGIPNTTILDLQYSFAQTSGNNGNIATLTNNVDNGQTQTYTYDALNRISTALTQATSGTDCWGQSFSYDPLGNLLGITSTQCSSPTLSISVNGNNQINSPSGFTYDAAGDMTADGGGLTYTYDAEHRIVTATGMSSGPYCYTYDGNGLRVEKANANGGSCTGTPTVDVLYWRDTSGNTIAETDSTGSTSDSNYHEYIFFGGRIARSDVAAGNVYYYYSDHLGSTRVMTQASGSQCSSDVYQPFGEEFNYASTCSTSYKFTGYERDSETTVGTDTGNDYAIARHYNPRLGRFMSPDSVEGDYSDPQTLNRYSYVTDNPVNLVDPTGLCGNPAVEAFAEEGSSIPVDNSACYEEDDGYGGLGYDCAPSGFPCVPTYIPPNASEQAADGPWTIGCEANGIPCGMPFPGGGGSGVSGCTYGSGSCGGMIYGYSKDDNGNIIGDYPGEELCSMVTDFGCGAYLYWSSGKWRPEDNASKLGRALNNAGIQSAANPCSVGLFYAASAIGGAATSGEVYAQGGEAATTYWPQALGWVSFWLNRGAASAATLLNLPKYYNATKGAVLGACNAMQ